ncbi:hypothetical protein BDIM_23140 [Brevundimonas diminuta ATCC 11568]|nr:hypothetical protein BDIM_23140 [Brevundimonas diminuta ATCC 11568]
MHLSQGGGRAGRQNARSQGDTPSVPSPSHRFNPATSCEQRS